MRTKAHSIAIALPFLAIACSDGKQTSSGQTSAPAPTSSTTASVTAAATAQSSATATGSETASAVPASFNEAEYVDWDEWGQECGFVVPKAPSALPPRILWAACGPELGLSGCKKLRVREGLTLHRVLAGPKRPGVVEIGYVEEENTETSKYAQLVIAEADGPTLAAFASKGHEAGKCDIDLVALHQGAYVAHLSGAAGASGTGAFVGAPTQTSKPVLIVSWEGGTAPAGASVSDVRWVFFGRDGAKTSRWGESEAETITQNALNVRPVLNHDEIFWADVEASVVKTAAKQEKLYASPDGGSVSSLGTDGTYLAMTYKTAGEKGKLSLAASQYAIEPDKVALQSLVPLPKTIDTAPWTVGCGYAAHAIGKNDVLIVRLKDGVSWNAASKGCDGDGLCLVRPLEVTCKDVFFEVANKSGQGLSIARVTFQGLGKGNKPATPPSPIGAPPGASTAGPTKAP